MVTYMELESGIIYKITRQTPFHNKYTKQGAGRQTGTGIGTPQSGQCEPRRQTQTCTKAAWIQPVMSGFWTLAFETVKCRSRLLAMHAQVRKREGCFN